MLLVEIVQKFHFCQFHCSGSNRILESQMNADPDPKHQNRILLDIRQGTYRTSKLILLALHEFKYMLHFILEALHSDPGNYSPKWPSTKMLRRLLSRQCAAFDRSDPDNYSPTWPSTKMLRMRLLSRQCAAFDRSNHRGSARSCISGSPWRSKHSPM
jgi:hypothetical protein